jgi:primosomal protein N' (replication factor Y)
LSPGAPPGAGSDPGAGDGGTVVEVLPDVSGLDRTFHYLVPASFGEVKVGTIVRVVLHGRRTRGWVVAAGIAVPEGLELKAVREIVSLGPPPDIVELCRWAAWRYAGRLRPLLLAASAPRIVRSLPAPTKALAAGLPAQAPPASPMDALTLTGAIATTAGEDTGLRAALRDVLSTGDAVLRLPPAMPRLHAVLGLLEHSRTADGTCGDPLILVESRADALILGGRLRAAGWPVSTFPEDWARVAAGGRVAIGTRNGVLGPGSPSLVVVLDAHSESYRSERVPTFDARVIAAERARATRAPVCFVTPCPSLELLAGRRLVTLERARERRGWGTVAVLDAREEDPRERGYPARLVAMVRRALTERPGERIVLVLNRSGRARLLACGLCRTVQRCPGCGAGLVQPVRPPKGELGELVCPQCHLRAPAICPDCGSGRLRILRPGVMRAGEEVAALLGLELGDVGVVTGARAALPDCRVLVGTESVLHRVSAASMVGFLDLDQELLAPRFRAGEKALVLLARAVRIAAASAAAGAGGRVVIRTSMPGHEVVQAAQQGDPGILLNAELPRRRALRLPPTTALAIVSGGGARDAVERLVAAAAALDVLPPEIAPIGEGRFLVRAASHDALSDAWAAVSAREPAGWAAVDARVEVDPLDV